MAKLWLSGVGGPVDVLPLDVAPECEHERQLPGLVWYPDGSRDVQCADCSALLSVVDVAYEVHRMGWRPFPHGTARQKRINWQRREQAIRKHRRMRRDEYLGEAVACFGEAVVRAWLAP